MDYRYQLAPYSGKNSRLVCPNCGRREFSPYIDAETGEILDETCGRCNRESHCGYHLTPSEFFRQHPEARPQGDAWRDAPAWLGQQQKPRQRLPLKPQADGPICELPKEYVEKTIRMEPASTFVQFMDTVLDPLIVEGLVFMYNLGVTRSGAAIFYEKDLQGRYRGGKIIQYNPATGHRIKDGTALPVNWIHPLFKKRGYIPEDWTMTQCLYGEHLLAEYPDKPVILVESEKTATLGAGFMPEYVWLATGGKTQLGDKLNVLAGRKVIAFPDIDAMSYWKEYFSQALPLDVTVVDIYEELATEEDRADQIDIADLLISWKAVPEYNNVSIPAYRPGTEHPAEQFRSAVTATVAQYFSSEVLPELDALIVDLDLVPVSIQKIQETS